MEVKADEHGYYIEYPSEDKPQFPANLIVESVKDIKTEEMITYIIQD